MRKMRVLLILLLFSLLLASCTGNGTTYLYDKEAHTHVFGNRYDITPVSCVAEGTEVRYCKICHEAVTETVAVAADIAARKHSFSDTVIAPTESAEGYTRRCCTVCPYVIERTDVIPARYALLTDTATKAEAPEGASGILMSDTTSHRLSYCVGYDSAVAPEAARRLAVALAITEELAREGTAFSADTPVALVSGAGAGNRYTVRDLLYEWIASGDTDVVRGLAAALDGSEGAFTLRVAARLARLGVADTATVDPFSGGDGTGSATLGATAVMLARALDEPLLLEAFADAVPRLQLVAGKKPVVYLSLGTLRITALEGEPHALRFSLVTGDALPQNLEGTLFAAVE